MSRHPRFGLGWGLFLLACAAEPSPSRLAAPLDAEIDVDVDSGRERPPHDLGGAASSPPDARPPTDRTEAALDSALARDADPPPSALPDAGSETPDGPPSAPPADTLFDDNAAPALIEIDMTPGDWAQLQATAREETWVPCSVTMGPERFERAAVRYKGSYGSLIACFDDAGHRLCPKLSLKVSFNEFDPEGRFRGVRKLVLNSCNRDPSCLHERLSYAAYRAAGLPASRAVHVRVRLPDGGAPGVYLLVENPDHEYLEDHFEDSTGNLYKEAWPAALRPDAYRAALVTNEEAGDVDRMVEFARLLPGLTEESFNAGIDPYIDRDAMLRYFVVDQLIENWDGIWKWYCQGPNCRNHNYFVYEDPSTRRFVVLPWDLDFTWTQPNGDLGRSWFAPLDCPPGETPGTPGNRAPQCDPLLRGLMRQNWALYREHLRRLVLTDDGPLSERALLARIDRYRAMIGDAMASDPLGPGGEAWIRAVAGLRQIVRAQIGEVARLIEAPADP